jgi:hypothetical protein
VVLELGAKGDAVRRLQLLLNGRLQPPCVRIVATPGEGRQSPNGVDPRALDILLPEAEDIQQRTPHLEPARCRKRRNERTDVPPLDDADPLGFENAGARQPVINR